MDPVCFGRYADPDRRARLEGVAQVRSARRLRRSLLDSLNRVVEGRVDRGRSGVRLPARVRRPRAVVEEVPDRVRLRYNLRAHRFIVVESGYGAGVRSSVRVVELEVHAQNRCMENLRRVLRVVRGDRIGVQTHGGVRWSFVLTARKALYIRGEGIKRADPYDARASGIEISAGSIGTRSTEKQIKSVERRGKLTRYSNFALISCQFGSIV